MTSQERKDAPVFSGFMKYFPDAIMEVARHSKQANEKHNPGSELHWDRAKSKDELDSEARHLIDVAKGDKYDEDGFRIKAAKAWRAMADLQKELESEKLLQNKD